MSHLPVIKIQKQNDFYLKWLFLICFLFSFLVSNAQNIFENHEDLKNQITRLINQYPDSALILIEKGLSSYDQEKSDSSYLGFFYLAKGVVFNRSDPDQATHYFFKAKEILEAIKNSQGLASVYLNLGTFANLDKSERIHFLQKAAAIHKETGDFSRQAEVYNNIGTVFLEVEEYDSAMSYLQKSLDLSHHANHKACMAFSRQSMADIFTAHEEYDTALVLLYEALYLMPKNEQVYILDIKSSICKVYFETEQKDSAFHYFSDLRNYFHLRPDIESDIYKSLTRYYVKKKNLEKALMYDDKADSVRDYIRSKNSENLLHFLEIEHEAKLREETVARLNANMKQADSTRMFLVIVLILLILFFSILIYQQRQKFKKEKDLILQKKQRVDAEKRRADTERKLLAAELRNSKLEKQYLNEELHYTNKELSSFATNIVNNQELWDKVKVQIKGAIKETNVFKMRDSLKELHTMLLHVFNNNEQRTEFLKRSRRLNHSLIFYLKNHYSSLTEKDINMLVLVLLKFSTKEIGVICNIEATSVRKKRQRVRKKLGMDINENFEDFFLKIMNDIEEKRKI